MPTARDFCSLAAKEAGILGVGQTLLDEDVNDIFTLLTRMLSQWQKRRWLVPNLITVSALGNSLKSNKIGPGQYYNTNRPDQIQSAYFVQENGGGGGPVSIPLRRIWSHEDYDLIALKDLNSWPWGFFYDGAFPYGNVFVYPIPANIYRIYLTVKQLIGFATGISAGTIDTAGAGYVDGVYVAVPLVNVSGTKNGEMGTADITVVGGIVTVFTINNPGNGYCIGDIETVNAANLGGTGQGLLWEVTGLESSLDSETDMPDEYDEAIHYSLAIRICSMYQVPVNPSTVGLARAALNTIRRSNSQVPTMGMPSGLRWGGNQFYIYAADTGYG